MFVSVFEIFKLGVGPSSSHTMGPMVAARRFLERLRDIGGAPAGLSVRLYGSLAFTGRGHGTDRAVQLGLLGQEPATMDIDAAETMLADLTAQKRLTPPGLAPLVFDPAVDLVFDFGAPLPLHANGMTFEARDAAGAPVFVETYYSVGGGFVMTEAELVADQAAERSGQGVDHAAPIHPYPFHNAAEMLEMGARSGLTVAAMKRANEVAHGMTRLDADLDVLAGAMHGCIDRGLRAEGELPGGLKVRRRARRLLETLVEERQRNDVAPHVVNDWLSLYAMAVNEENAAGGRVVTAPTNGAAGTIPAVLRYLRDHCGGTPEAQRDFLLTAAAIGGLIKFNASISGAEVGCQGEVGSASAMAAAGLCAALGGTNAQIENAAEIALEHHLGMTCDPVGGLVQVPCIERNAMGAIKAVSAASLALRGDGTHFMPLDNCIETMRQTGHDMNHHYKETSLGGLAVNLPEC